MNNQIVIRFANKEDVPAIFSLIEELAEFEKLSNQIRTNEAELKQTLFGVERFVEILIAEFDGQIVGQALFFKNFSTFLGKPGIYLEDLYVKPKMRGKGVGKALLDKIISIAKERNYGRVEWSVLDWNESAINFYKKIGAVPMEEWKLFRLTSDKF
ncbi:MAG: GNAT family N-acetyltransferase [Ignavibacteriales bacterium]|nr:GNAT family N-acetyltransferase [Ignavibacteriales bacterium]